MVIQAGKLARVAIAQLTSSSNVVSNMSRVELMTQYASKQKADIIFFPENFHFMGTSKESSLRVAEPLSGPSMAKYRSLAKSNNIWLSLGGFQESASSNEAPDSKIYNTHVLINNEGSIQASYRKTHLFDYDLHRESELTRAGEEVVISQSPLGDMGLAICYDVRFPPLFASQRSAGARVLTVPAAFTYATGEAHWHTLLRARAIENQCFVIAAAQTGFHNKAELDAYNLSIEKEASMKQRKPIRRSFGHSLIVNPWGKIVGEIPYVDDASSKTAVEHNVLITDLDLSYVDQIRQMMPVDDHCRPEVYNNIIKK